jgi:hypothetical protein
MEKSPQHPTSQRRRQAATAHRHTNAPHAHQAAPVRMLLLLSLAIVVASIHPALELVAYLGETGPV